MANLFRFHYSCKESPLWYPICPSEKGECYGTYPTYLLEPVHSRWRVHYLASYMYNVHMYICTTYERMYNVRTYVQCMYNVRILYILHHRTLTHVRALPRVTNTANHDTLVFSTWLYCPTPRDTPHLGWPTCGLVRSGVVGNSVIVRWRNGNDSQPNTSVDCNILVVFFVEIFGKLRIVSLLVLKYTFYDTCYPNTRFNTTFRKKSSILITIIMV